MFQWIDTAKRYYIKDPTDGGSVLRSVNREIIHSWCMAHCKSGFWVGMGWACFKLESDALMFLLRWG